MTKRFTIAMVALALFVLMAIAPVSAAIAANGTSIDAGATIFIGEEGLNVTHALVGADNTAAGYLDGPVTNTSIGWWASAAVIKTTAPTKSINLAGRMNNFQVAPADFVGYTGNWYLLDGTGAAAAGVTSGLEPRLVFTVADPTLDIKVWDRNQITDISGKSVPQGTEVQVRIDTNMYPATYSKRNNTVYSTMYRQAWSTTNDGVGNFTIDATTGVASTSHTVGNLYGWWTNVTAPSSTAGAAGSVNQFCNYTVLNVTTYGTMGDYSCMYWNESAANTWASSAGTQVFSGRNWSMNASGTSNNAASPYGQMFIFDTSAGYGNNYDVLNLIPNQSVDGYIDLKVKDESGSTLVALIDTNGAARSILKNFVNQQPFFWGVNNQATEFWWKTDSVDTATGQYNYPPGTYTISAESKLNKMKDNYKNAGADYTGKTVSQSYTLTLVSDTVKIEANKDSVVRSKPFSITVTGKPSTVYYVWVKGTSSMDGGYDNQPPMIALNQEKVYNDTPLYTGTSPYVVRPIGNYAYENGAGAVIASDVGTDTATGAPAYNGTRYYCEIITSTSGTRTVEFVTTNWTSA